MSTLQTAQKYLAAGYSVIPVKLDGTKAPHGAWEQFQSSRPTHADLAKWFPTEDTHGIGLVQGAVSGHAEMLEFETQEGLNQWEQGVRDHGRQDLLDLLNLRVRSGGGGIHFYYRCPDGIEGNQKLARLADGKVKIETRGEGGQVVAPGSPVRVHKSGNPYLKLSGSFEAVPTLTAADREFAFVMARSLNEHIPSTRKFTPATGARAGAAQGNRPGGASELRPGDDYNARATQAEVIALLEKHGWQVAGGRGDVCDITRPGKSTHDGTSGTVGYCGQNGFYCFTSSAPPFEPETYYDPFGVYCLLEHGGRFDDAARELGKAGYGERLDERKSRESTEKLTPNIKPKVIELGRFNLTDAGNAERLVARHGGSLRYSPSMGWLIWNGKRWERDASGEVHRRALETVRSIYAEASKIATDYLAYHTGEDDASKKADDKASPIRKHAVASESHSRLNAMVDRAVTLPGVYVPTEDLDKDPWLLNCQNGTIDLRTGELRPHDPNDLITKISPVSYHTDAPAPLWAKCLGRWQPDEEVRSFLARAAGYTLTGNVGEETVFFLYGDGSNGKSKFTSSLEFIMGDYSARIRSDVLMQTKRETTPGTTPDLERLPGTRLLIVSEIEEGARIREGFLKDMTGGESVFVNPKYKQGFQFKPQFKPWLYGNHKPVFRGSDKGIRRRLPLIPFTATIPEGEKDTDLENKLRAEGEGILAWAVRGCLEWQKTRLSPPTGVVTATDNYHQAQDLFGQWITTCCALVPTAWTPTAELRRSYESWCEEEGFRASLDGNAFTERLLQAGCEDARANRDGKRVRGWKGVGILSGNPVLGHRDTEDSKTSKTGYEEVFEAVLCETLSPGVPVSHAGEPEDPLDDPFAPGGSMHQPPAREEETEEIF